MSCIQQDTMKHERFEMLGSADELQMLQTIVSVMNAKKTLDIGSFYHDTSFDDRASLFIMDP